MIRQITLEKLISYDLLTDEERANPELIFQHYGQDAVVERQGVGYYTYKLFWDGADYTDIHVDFGPDMFYLSYEPIIKSGYAVANDNLGGHVCILENTPEVYRHGYVYEGGVDLWFLDQYDCVVLHDCNEHSVELCRTAMRLWKGKHLILAGANWEKMIPLLPDLPCECWFEPEWDLTELPECLRGLKILNVVYGIPHAEPLDRYRLGIMYYAEVMSFTFLFSDYRELGKKNENINFCVIDGNYDSLGLFAILTKVISVALYVKSKGMVPVIRLQMCGRSFYQNGSDDDAWGKFFEQPEGYSLEDVMHSKHVFFTPKFYNGSVQSYIMEQAANKTMQLKWPNGTYNARVREYIGERMKRYLPIPEHTLGVLARGTDYVGTHLRNHAVHASKEMLCDKIDSMMQEDVELQHIYIATEDLRYSEFFRERYGDKVSFTDQERYVTAEGEKLADLHSRETVKRDGFLMGAEYIASIYLLAQCRSLLASGGCGGLDEALKENKGKYHEVYTFDLGVNK